MEQNTMQPMWTATYKQTTKTMYYFAPLKELAENRQRKQVALKVAALQTEGVTILLPYALCIDIAVNERITHTGRAVIPPVASLDGNFTQVQCSPYKINPPYSVHTYLWQVDGYSGVVYGTIGLTRRGGRGVMENGDLLIAKETEVGTLKVWIYKGFARKFNSLPVGLKELVEALKVQGQI